MLARLIPALTRIVMLFTTALLAMNAIDVLTTRYTLPRSEIPLKARQIIADVPFRTTYEAVELIVRRRIDSSWLGVHVWPVIPWLILSFLQTWTWLRKRFLGLHRWLGRLYIALSALMTLAYCVAFWKDEVSIGVQQTSLRSLETTFTFRTACYAATVWWAICIIMLWGRARGGRIEAHRYWAMQFVGAGFGVGVMRWLMAVYLWVRYPKSGDRVISVWDESVGHGYTLWTAFVGNALLMHVWFAVNRKWSKT